MLQTCRARLDQLGTRLTLTSISAAEQITKQQRSSSRGATRLPPPSTAYNKITSPSLLTPESRRIVVHLRLSLLELPTRPRLLHLRPLPHLLRLSLDRKSIFITVSQIPLRRNPIPNPLLLLLASGPLPPAPRPTHQLFHLGEPPLNLTVPHQLRTVPVLPALALLELLLDSPGAVQPHPESTACFRSRAREESDGA